MVVCTEQLNSASTTLTIKVKCDCHGTETLAEIRDGKVIIFDTRHGQKHYVILNLAEFV